MGDMLLKKVLIFPCMDTFGEFWDVLYRVMYKVGFMS